MTSCSPWCPRSHTSLPSGPEQGSPSFSYLVGGNQGAQQERIFHKTNCWECLWHSWYYSCPGECYFQNQTSLPVKDIATFRPFCHQQ